MLAYIDGGTGGMVLQVLLGSIVGAFVIFKAAIGGFFARFHREKDEGPEAVQEGVDQQ
jgi:hypothetical protein